eukprot:CFRG2901T1
MIDLFRENVNTVIIGGGHAGLSMSAVLLEQRRDHVVLEKGRCLEQWRSKRWDSFMMNTPIDYSLLYGQKPNPDNGFDGKQILPLEKILPFWEGYIKSLDIKIREYTEVVSIEEIALNDCSVGNSARYVVTVRSDDGGPITYTTTNIITCCGNYHRPSIPNHLASVFPKYIKQLRVGTYKNPDDSLAMGGVLIVGGGQTGFQFAEEIVKSGRKVIMATSKVPGTPRFYRGEDTYYWLERIGMMSMPRSALQKEDTRYTTIPLISSDHAISHHSLARLGVRLVGTLESVSHSNDSVKVTFKDNLQEHIAFCEETYMILPQLVEEWIGKMGTVGDYPPAELESAWAPYAPLIEEKAPLHMDLGKQGITNVLWATGWKPDFSFIHVKGLKESFGRTGRPLTCESSKPGFFYLGFPWLRGLNSANIQGHHADALYIARQLGN